jgi:hypothetical protein
LKNPKKSKETPRVDASVIIMKEPNLF